MNHLETNKDHILGDGWNKRRGITKVKNNLFSYSGVISKRQNATYICRNNMYIYIYIYTRNYGPPKAGHKMSGRR